VRRTNGPGQPSDEEWRGLLGAPAGCSNIGIFDIVIIDGRDWHAGCYVTHDDYNGSPDCIDRINAAAHVVERLSERAARDFGLRTPPPPLPQLPPGWQWLCAVLGMPFVETRDRPSTKDRDGRVIPAMSVRRVPGDFFSASALAVKELAAPQVESPTSTAKETEATSGAGSAGVKASGTATGASGDTGSVRRTVFISYSHKDERWRDDLLTHLKPYLRDGSVTVWSDQQIAPGSNWFKDIMAAIAEAKVAVMLVTADFLASDFIHEHELGPFLKEAERGGVRIIWVPVKACSQRKTPLKDYQAVHGPAHPLASIKRADRDKAWVRVCEEIEKAVVCSS
jgi:hypothetical protein